jgi:endoglycosylceramidase
MPILGRTRVAAVLAAAVSAVLTVGAVVTTPSASSAPLANSAVPLGQSGTWITDSQGRAVVLHGLNEVFKVPPYDPSASGFSDDDAAFLQANGFNAMRVGVIWAAVEPRPGVYDEAYLASISQTVQTLAAHGIVSLLDFHQDLYNEKFQGEGAPAWAVQDGGLANPALGFPWNYFGNPAEERSWDAFWANAKAPDGVGLQVHYARAWAHVAAEFRNDPGVFGYELVNEPWPGTVWEPCAVAVVGCPLFDAQLTAFYQRVTSAIRTADPATTVWIEPNVLFSNFDATQVGTVHDAHVGWAFHDYCGTASIGLGTTLCAPLDQLTVASAKVYSSTHHVPWLMTEFGATNDLANLSEMVSLADKNRLGWFEWAYTGHDKTSSSPNGQALVLDPTQPPTGTNVVAGKLKVLAEPYPQAVSGTPTSWSFAGGVFRLIYSTVHVSGAGRFSAGSPSDIAIPAIAFPTGYTVTAIGATVVSAPGAPALRVVSLAGAQTVSLTVRAVP